MLLRTSLDNADVPNSVVPGNHDISTTRRLGLL